MLRSIYRNIEGYQSLFGGDLKSRISHSMDIMHEYVQRIGCGDMVTTVKSSQFLGESTLGFGKKDNKELWQMSMAEFYISYN